MFKTFVEKALDGYAMGFVIGVTMGFVFGYIGVIWAISEPLGG